MPHLSRLLAWPLAIALASLLASASLAAVEPWLPADRPGAAYGPWRSSRIGGGGYLQEVVTCPTDPQRLHVWVDVGGCYVSDDGGGRWRMLHGNLPMRRGVTSCRGLIVDPRDHRRLLVAVGTRWAEPEGVFLSEDGGETWVRTLGARFDGNGAGRSAGRVLVRDPVEPDTVYAASIDDGVFRSDDGGKTWRPIGMKDHYPCSVVIDRSARQRIWVATTRAEVKWAARGWTDRTYEPSFHRSDDGGVTWRAMATAVDDCLQDPEDSTLLYALRAGSPVVSRDHGESWQDFAHGLPYDPAAAQVYVSDSVYQDIAAGPGFLLCGSRRGTIWRRDRGAAAWTRIERKRVDEGDWYARMQPGQKWQHFGAALGWITVDQRQPKRWWFTDWYGLYRSDDAGTTWRLSLDGIESTCLHALAQDPSDPGIVHLGMADNATFRSLDGGETFVRGDFGWSNTKGIEVGRDRPQRIFCTGSLHGDWEASQVYLSDDRGQSWTRSPGTGLPAERRCGSLVVDPRTSDTLYLGVAGGWAPNEGGVYRSIDGGRSWTWMSEGFTADAFFHPDIWGHGRQLAMDAAGVLIALSAVTGRVARWDGARWHACAAGEGRATSVCADPSVPGRFYLARASGLLRSVDSGVTWQTVLPEATHHVTVDLATPGRLAVSTDGAIAFSTDAGGSWVRLPPHPDPSASVLAFCGDRLISGTNGSGTFWMPLSTAGRAAIRAKPDPQPTTREEPRRSLLLNGDMTAGAEVPDGWSARWTGQGELRATRDLSVFHSAPASLSLASHGGPAVGSIAQRLTVAAGTRLVASAWARADGVRCDECLVGLQAFDAQGRQVGWSTLGAITAGRGWTEVRGEWVVPGEAVAVNLIVTFTGDGGAWLDDCTVMAE